MLKKFFHATIVLLIISMAACAILQKIKGAKPLSEIYIVPILGHLDYGFTASQREVRALWPDIYRQGIEFLEAHPDAKLTSGCLLPLEWFRDKAGKDEWSRFRQLVKSGRWELTAGLLHANTSVFSEAESARLFFASRRWAEEFDVPVRTWLHADVPGLTWNMAEAATDARIKFVAVGANEMRGLSGLPEGLPPLFFWEAPDGERVIVSVRGGAGYMEGGLDLTIHVGEGLQDRLEVYMKELRKKGYKLDKSLVLFSTGDNNGPKALPELIKTVKQWNLQKRLPKLRISTLNEFFKNLSIEEKALLPVVRGDWPASGHWEALVRRTPHAESAARSAKRKLLAAQLLSVITENKEEAGHLRNSWRKVLLYDEHSGAGAWPGKLTRKQLIEQNVTEHAFAIEALKSAEASLRRQAFSQHIKLLLLVPSKPYLICNVSGEKHGGIMELAGRINISTAQGLPSYSGDISAWTCAISGDWMVKITPPDKKDYISPVRINKPVWLEPPLFLESTIMRVGRSVNFRSTKEIFKLSDRAYAVRLTWGPASKLPPVANMRGWVAPFSFGKAIESFESARGGLLLSKGDSLEYQPSWDMPGEGIIVKQLEGTRVMISSIGGLPVFPSVPPGRDAIWWLLYVQERPVAFRGGKTGLVPHEPAAVNKPVQSIWVVKRSTSDEGNNLLQLRDMSMPIIGFPYREGVAGETRHLSRGETLLRSFSMASPEISIEEIKWADFGNGVVIKLRNISNQPVTTNVISHLGPVENAILIDGLERNINTIDHGEGWVKAVLKPKEVIRMRLMIGRKRIDEYE